MITVTKEKAQVCHLFKKSLAALLSRIDELPNGQHIQRKWYFTLHDFIGNFSALQYADEVSFIWDENAPVPPGRYPIARSVEKIAAVKATENNGGGQQ